LLPKPQNPFNNHLKLLLDKFMRNHLKEKNKK